MIERKNVIVHSPGSRGGGGIPQSECKTQQLFSTLLFPDENEGAGIREKAKM